MEPKLLAALGAGSLQDCKGRSLHASTLQDEPLRLSLTNAVARTGKPWRDLTHPCGACMTLL